MSTRSMRLVVPVALAAVALAGCGNQGSTTSESVKGHPASASASTSAVTVTATPTEATATSTTEAAQPTTEAPTEATSSAAPTDSATPTATGTDTTDGFGSAAPTPKGSRSAVEAARGQGSPDVQGEAGGGLTVDGVEVGRGTGSTASVWKTLGAPSQPVSSCRSDGTTFERHTYGGLEVYVPTTPVSGEYGWTWPVGAISGWTITGPASGTIKATGPQGTTLGTGLATLRQRFTTKQWDSVNVATIDGTRRFVVAGGDTMGASFSLGADDAVTAMTAGIVCR